MKIDDEGLITMKELNKYLSKIITYLYDETAVPDIN